MSKRSRAAIVWTTFGVVLLVAGCGGEEADETTPAEVALEEPTRPFPGDMLEIPAGELTIGTDEDPNTPPFAAPAHAVKVDAFMIDAYEVTNGQFMQFALGSDSEVEGKWRDSYQMGREDFPVVNITWADADAYCQWAGKRLPTEAEWEYAARGREGLRYPWGDEFNANNVNTTEAGVNNIVEVGKFETDKSPFGVYDMMGNVQEWTSDRFAPYPGSSIPKDNNAFRMGYRVVRGGGYAVKGRVIGLWLRMGYAPKSQFGQGFRCAKDMEAAEQQ